MKTLLLLKMREQLCQKEEQWTWKTIIQCDNYTLGIGYTRFHESKRKRDGGEQIYSDIAEADDVGNKEIEQPGEVYNVDDKRSTE